MRTAQLLSGVEEQCAAQFRAVPCAAIGDLLKQRTQRQHQRLEKHLEQFQRVVSMRDYRELLGRFYGIYAPLEAVLRRALVPLHRELQWGEHEKTPRLSADLSACGMSDAEIVALPRWQRIAPFPSAAQALGQLYALEGATQGGPTIARQLRRRLRLKKNLGLTFFLSHGQRVPERWRQFDAILARRLATPIQQEQAVGAAIEILENFDGWLNGGAHKPH